MVTAPAVSDTQGAYAIETFALTRKFGQLTAVDQLSLRVPKGQIFGLVGPDGAGKTTTIRMLCTVIPPSSGSARVAGYDVVREAAQVRLRIGYMSQRFTLYGDLTVDENLRFFAEIFDVPVTEREPRMRELLEFAGLTPFRNRRAEHLSGGMKQKLALACTLIHEPEVLLLDEPTTGVDPIARRDFWKILYSLMARGVTIVVSTPYMDEAERCNAVAFMSQGRVLATGAPDELKTRFPWQVIALRTSSQEGARQHARQLPAVEDVQIMGAMLHLYTSDAGATLRALPDVMEAHGIQVLAARQVAPSMEDIFMWFMREQVAAGFHARDGGGDVAHIRG